MDVKDMSTFGMGDPLTVEPSIDRHLTATHRRLLANPKLVLPNKMDCFSASVFQSSYRGNLLAVRALNVSPLLSVYQAKVMGTWAGCW